MKKKPTILITNDDGVHAPGIAHLWQTLREIADVTVAAPSQDQSGVGMAHSPRSPLYINEIRWSEETTVKVINGTPSDCIKMALSALMDNPPELIASGINNGSNAGRNLLYSGTVAAVIEGTLRGIPGIAFSCEEYFQPDFITTLPYIAEITQHTLNNPLPPGTFLNVTFPHIEGGQYRGIKLASQGKQYWIENLEKRLHPEGTPYYWLGGQPIKYDEEEGSDIALLSQGYITVVPIQINDLTNHSFLQQHQENYLPLVGKSKSELK
ncbi:5'/3'-nucleotidase SurE [Simkania negevensis]|uniref:5'-nucleotidase SurE n=1 Tax=Simkania negevensis TaxID=83561 RepID=A0ABS3AQC8_9BACT|nr:5'/3'-nucleotidase SurE [Simkania negevensis]